MDILVQTVRMMRLALPHMKGRPGAAVISCVRMVCYPNL